MGVVTKAKSFALQPLIVIAKCPQKVEILKSVFKGKVSIFIADFYLFFLGHFVSKVYLQFEKSTENFNFFITQ
jgi:hypothetical protein